jgi:hypothetical protein
MNDWFTLHTFVAFLLGVMLSAMVKSTVGRAKSKVGA